VSKLLEDTIVDLVGLFSPYLEGIDSILDVGTGTSIPIHVFADFFPDIQYETVDVVDIRKRKKLPFTIYSGTILPYDNTEFDVSILNETLHHCEDPQTVLSEAHRVAKLVYVIEHFPKPNINISDLIQTELDALANFDMKCKNYKPFTEFGLNRNFEKTGLKVRDKFEIPYYGKREIRKYFFKLE